MPAPNPNDLPKTVPAPRLAPDGAPTAPGTDRATNSEFNLSAPLAPGEVGALGPYRLVKELGRGGMGAVYLAVDTRLNRKLALKVMLPEFAANAGAKERFIREAKAAALVSHDNVVTVYEADERAGVPYIAMQLLSGCSLDEFLKKKGTPALHHVVRIATETALGLAAAHKLGLVHRDFKPGNLWLESPNGRVKVLDFGLARPVDEQSELTKSGAILGTPAYMSPEQARGRKVDARGDVFSLGAVLYRLRTGRTPFAGANVMEVLMALGSDEPTPVRELNPTVPEPLAVLVHRMLAKNPDARPQSAAEVARLLPLALSGGAPELSASSPAVVPLPPVMVVSASPENVFADLDAADSPSAERTEALTHVSRPAESGKGPLIAVGVAVLLAALAVGLLLALKGGGKPDDTAKTDPPPLDSPKEKSKPKPPTGKKDEPAPKKDEPPPALPARKPPKPWVPPAAVPVGASPFDKLDPNAIPAEDKLGWHPNELVAVAGTHSPRTFGPLHAARGFAVSPDGALVATGGEFSPLRIWDVKTQKPKFDLPPLFENSDSAFTSDGRYLITYQDGLNRYMRFDLSDPTKPATEWPSTLPPQLKGMGFWLAPNGSRMVSQTAGHALAYDLTTNPAKELAKLEIPWDWGSRVISPNRDCTRLAMFRADPKGAAVFDLTADGPKEVFAVRADSALIALSPDGTKLVTAHVGTLRLWDLAVEKPQAVEFAPNTRGPIAFNPAGTRMVTQDADRGLRLWDTTQSPPEFLWDAPITLSFDGAMRVGFAGADGNTLVALTRLGFLYFIEVSERKPKLLASVAPTEPVGAELTIDGATGRVALGRASDHRLQVWDFARERPAPTDQALPAGTHARTPDLKSYMVWDGGRPVLHLPGKQPAALPGMSPIGSFNADGRTYWALTNGPPHVSGRFVRFELSGPEPKEAGSFERVVAHTSRVWAVRNDTVVACTTNGRLSFWEATVPEPKFLSQLPDGNCGDDTAQVFPDGERVLKHGLHYIPEVWQLTATGWTKQWSASGDNRSLLAVHPSGKLFAVYAGGEITVYHAGTFEKVRTIPHGAGKYPPQKIEFAPDGRHLFVINSFNTVYVLRLNDLPERASAIDDRATAEWVLSVGGTVQLDGTPTEFRSAADLPNRPFKVVTASLRRNRNVTADGLRNLRGLGHLTALWFDGTPITDDGVAHFAGLRALRVLGLPGTRVTSKSLEVVAGLTELDDVSFDDAPITDADLAHFKGHTRMKKMYLHGTALTDDALAHLRGMRELVHLGVTRTAITEKGARALADALPNCRIEWSGGVIEPTKK